MEILKNIKNIHFIGIGGASMNGLAKLMACQGKNVTGTDDNITTNILKNLENNKIKFYEKTPLQVLDNSELIVYTNAVRKNHPDMQYSFKMQKNIIERAEFLGILSNFFTECIAICGTHGKTTTTGLTSFAMQIKNPTSHIGGSVEKFGGNIKIGTRHYFITEACEYNKSFLHLHPTVTVITNIEQEHMDTFKTTENLYNCFIQLAKQTSDVIITTNNLPILNQLFNKNITAKIICVDIDKKSDFWATNITETNGKFSFDIYERDTKINKIKLNILGKHNVLNALFAIAVSRHFNIPYNNIIDGIQQFEGVERRFQFLQKEPFGIIHDYAHHPTEIKTAISTAKLLGYEKIFCIFEPHTYSRTKYLMKDFLTCFNETDELILLPTYSAREKEQIGRRSIDLFNNLQDTINVSYFKNPDLLNKFLIKNVKNNQLTLWLGAGTIYNFAKNFKDLFKKTSI